MGRAHGRRASRGAGNHNSLLRMALLEEAQPLCATQQGREAELIAAGEKQSSGILQQLQIDVDIDLVARARTDHLDLLYAHGFEHGRRVRA